MTQRKGAPPTWDEFFIQCYPRLCRWARIMDEGSASAGYGFDYEGAVDEAFAKLKVRYDAIEFKGPPEAYVRTMVNNALADFHRKRNRELPSVPLEYMSSDGTEVSNVPSDDSPGPEDQVIQKETREAVMAVIRTLTSLEREILLMTLKGMRPAEIAAILGISSSAARVRLHRAKNSLLKALKEEEIGISRHQIKEVS
ncbi:RNA polymerase sigma factor [Streptomyces phyllanthi]|uniref:RNA polymerase sigma factor n=1 Tax=Streptomyces phyllanthi TaxID=1803180 RepID=A0A5N8WK01_9ACTN|nr:RNA polymerase sigma factor [Streptomyces phyllanthi]MPY46605.1 RNA polymerase sigma factor [Streptomyces phyllanthi]